MKEHERFTDKFVKTETLDDPLRVTVKRVDTVTFSDGTQGLAAALFEDERLMPLNRTNFRSIRELAGHDDDSKWDGTKIEIYRTTTTFGSDTNKPCMRIRRPSENGGGAGESEFPFSPETS